MAACVHRYGPVTLGALALLSTAPPALAEPFAAEPKPRPAVYGPRLDPAPAVQPGGRAPEQPKPYKPVFSQMPPYERALADWKNRQYGCMKKGTLCFQTKPLPSDLLEIPRP